MKHRKYPSPQIGEAVFRGKKTHYNFEVYPVNIEFNEVPAVYIISKRKIDRHGRGHHALFHLGQTESLAEEIKSQKQGKWVKEWKANVVSVLLAETEKSRLAIEADLKAAHTIPYPLKPEQKEPVRLFKLPRTRSPKTQAPKAKEESKSKTKVSKPVSLGAEAKVGKKFRALKPKASIRIEKPAPPPISTKQPKAEPVKVQKAKKALTAKPVQKTAKKKILILKSPPLPPPQTKPKKKKAEVLPPKVAKKVGKQPAQVEVKPKRSTAKARVTVVERPKGKKAKLTPKEFLKVKTSSAKASQAQARVPKNAIVSKPKVSKPKKVTAKARTENFKKPGLKNGARNQVLPLKGKGSKTKPVPVSKQKAKATQVIEKARKTQTPKLASIKPKAKSARQVKPAPLRLETKKKRPEAKAENKSSKASSRKRLAF